MSTGTIQLHRVLRAKPERIYKAFLDADAMARTIWGRSPINLKEWGSVPMLFVKKTKGTGVELF